MAILMQMHWEGVKPEQYETLRGTVNWEGNIPKGAIFHVSAFDDKGLHVVDLWDTKDDLNNFIEKRLMPEVMKLGVTNQPNVEVYPVHATFTPGYTK